MGTQRAGVNCPKSQLVVGILRFEPRQSVPKFTHPEKIVRKSPRPENQDGAAGRECRNLLDSEVNSKRFTFLWRLGAISNCVHFIPRFQVARWLRHLQLHPPRSTQQERAKSQEPGASRQVLRLILIGSP